MQRTIWWVSPYLPTVILLVHLRSRIDSWWYLSVLTFCLVIAFVGQLIAYEIRQSGRLQATQLRGIGETVNKTLAQWLESRGG
jgi:hypothetical protein